MAKIARVWAREILDSRGTPTVEAACQVDTGHIAVSAVPSGTSTGTYEARELRDGDTNRYMGKGVLTAVNNINTLINSSLAGIDPMDQQSVDMRLLELDGTENKSKIGANAILAVSQVVTKAGSMAAQMPLYKWIQALAQKKGINVSALKVPTPLSVVIEGGLHGSGNLDFQEFWLIPATSKPFDQGLQMITEIYHALGENLSRRGAVHSTGEEGAYTPNLFTNIDALGILVDTIKSSHYQLGRDVFFGLDTAANSFYDGGSYTIRDRSGAMNEDGIIQYYKELNDIYHLAALEDPLHEDAWEGWKKLNAMLGSQLMVIGDDLLVTNLKRLQMAIEQKSCNAILVKPNQVGSITETLDVIKQARDAQWKVVISHRGGETNDSFIADFAVGVGSDFTKFGAPASGERVAKYNRLSSIFLELQIQR